GGLAAGERIAQSDAQAPALPDAQRERLDRVVLEPGGHRRLTPASTGARVLRLLGADPREVLLERVHPPRGVVVEVPVEGDVDVDGHNVVASHRCGAMACAAGSSDPWVARGGQQVPLSRLVA